MPAAGTESWLLPLSSPGRRRQEGERLTVCLVPYAAWQRSLTDTAGVWTTATGHFLFFLFFFQFFYNPFYPLPSFCPSPGQKCETTSPPQLLHWTALTVILYFLYSCMAHHPGRSKKHSTLEERSRFPLFPFGSSRPLRPLIHLRTSGRSRPERLSPSVWQTQLGAARGAECVAVSASHAPRSRRALIFSFRSCKQTKKKKLLAPCERQGNCAVCWVCRPLLKAAAAIHSTCKFLKTRCC